MIVVALKFFFLAAFLSWYSAAIFSLINEYFRNSFMEYIKETPTDEYKSNTIKYSLPSTSNHIESTPINEIYPTEYHNRNGNVYVNRNSDQCTSTHLLYCTRFDYWQEIVLKTDLFINVCLVNKCVFIDVGSN